MDSKPSEFQDLSSVQAVFVGALAPGVNGPTWTTLKMVFVMLGFSLILMLVLGFTSSDTALILHVGFLVLITLTLFLLLTRFMMDTIMQGVVLVGVIDYVICSWTTTEKNCSLGIIAFSNKRALSQLNIKCRKWA